jgi:hypothetical protein
MADKGVTDSDSQFAVKAMASMWKSAERVGWITKEECAKKFASARKSLGDDCFSAKNEAIPIPDEYVKALGWKTLEELKKYEEKREENNGGQIPR